MILPPPQPPPPVWIKITFLEGPLFFGYPLAGLFQRFDVNVSVVSVCAEERFWPNIPQVLSLFHIKWSVYLLRVVTHRLSWFKHKVHFFYLIWRTYCKVKNIWILKMDQLRDNTNSVYLVPLHSHKRTCFHWHYLWYSLQYQHICIPPPYTDSCTHPPYLCWSYSSVLKQSCRLCQCNNPSNQ